MEPIKFEDNIREKLQEREITPSKTIWKKLANQLETNPKDYTNKSIWFAVAAGFIGIVIITSFIIKNNFSPSQAIPDLVEETPLKEEVPPFQDVVSNKILNNDSAIKIVENNKKHLQTSLPEIIALSENKEISKRNKTDKELATIDVNETSEEKIILEGSNNEDFINFKIGEVVAQVKELKANNKSVSTEEIDSLLFIAQNEIKSKRIIKNKKVEATVLLNIVESELETSFRDKVFEALGDGFEKVRTAVVERDN